MTSSYVYVQFRERENKDSDVILAELRYAVDGAPGIIFLFRVSADSKLI